MTFDPSKIDWTATGALAALCISIFNLVNSIYIGQRDRAHLKLASRGLGGSVEIVMMNAGRRPIVIRMVGCTTEDRKSWVGTFVKQEKGGIRLEEHARYEYTVNADDLVWPEMDNEGHETELNDAYFIWVEDALGNRYEVPGSREHIKALRESLAKES